MDQFPMNETITVQLREVRLPDGSAHCRPARRPQKARPVFSVVPVIRVAHQHVMNLRLLGLATDEQDQ
jgi:hypothetical protein